MRSRFFPTTAEELSTARERLRCIVKLPDLQDFPETCYVAIVLL
jgi:hypothetical protein